MEKGSEQLPKVTIIGPLFEPQLSTVIQISRKFYGIALKEKKKKSRLHKIPLFNWCVNTIRNIKYNANDDTI